MNANPMWNAILKWSMAQSDGLGDSTDVQPLTPEKQAWLEKVMDSMVVDLTKRMKIVTQVLKMPLDAKALRGASDQLGQLEEYKVTMSAQTTDTELIEMLKAQKENALDELDELVERIDNAKDLHKLGGLKPLVEHLHSPFLSIRWRAANALSTTVQNNPQPQEWATQCGAVPSLVSLATLDMKVDTSAFPDVKHSTAEKDIVKVATKAVLALSSLVRHNPSASQQFLKLDGLNALLGLLQDSRADKRLKRKSVGLMGYFFEQAPLRASSTAQASIPVLIQCMNSQDIDVREGALNALMSLLEDGAHATNMSVATQPQLNLRKHATARLKEISSFSDPDDIEMVEDEKVTLQRLAKLLSATKL